MFKDPARNEANAELAREGHSHDWQTVDTHGKYEYRQCQCGNRALRVIREDLSDELVVLPDDVELEITGR